MKDNEIAAQIAASMAASASAAAFTIVTMASGNREWAAVAILSALASLAFLGPVLRDLWRQRP
ncbi:hypothetical protein [Streptomyces stelliscabiei]|uniref:VIT1/CCC1 family predicted Fe2+/Mn2+ transporter n=1 Tax=Streptomyces stelliscabiei TaxID=146820 RepID=A0A8I0TRS8_9ACTN|nr:hypothetical protein [Streptomyces stelliscabiei]KND45380.1 hypothetical protein IQ64_07260 [Streptomyces stelliscabiei]MBE1597231.1 VIT1/CCC1 family predicted Fe2+/Mn2+ transporter [Streptomyces stelliscabiei]